MLLAGWSVSSAEPAVCEACSCGPVADGACDQVTIHGRSTDVCGGTLDILRVNGVACASAPANYAAISFIDADYSGTCGAATGGALIEAAEPVRSSGLALCGSASAGGCGDVGESCAPLPTDDAPLCVARDGDHACPAGFPAARLVFQSEVDTRACAACNCVARADACLGAVRLYANQTCSESGANGTLSTTATGCQVGGTSGIGSVRIQPGGLTPTNPRCQPLGGSSQGCVAPGPTTTVCCQPAAARAVGCPSGPGPAMHLVEVDATRSYCIDTHEVTNSQYAEFLDDGVHPSTDPRCAGDPDNVPETWPPADAREPVTRVDFCDAAAYCEWAGKRLCGAIDPAASLSVADAEDPSLSEWHHICARGPARCDGGNDVGDPGLDPCCRAEMVYDLAGNAREWIDACDDGECATHRDDTCDDVNGRDPASNGDSRLGFRCCADAI